ncbi:dCMP hydroxymethylase [Serratia phage Muldoon]|uniref:dCMP hydroxymethylase n=1 Tax=Serratia phage Muldoon TaxID=2601678 RepID=A0A5P8PH36_9CAUD|nr:thymidylate synthase [Serratia phage Muldoon]QFR55996.1 dCMP hydroxymethylase [Serratia phage Muldoon]
MHFSIEDIRDSLMTKFLEQDFVTDKTGVKTVEMLGVSFIADEDVIFGKPNLEYVERELEWYKSKSLFVKDIPGKVPAIWQAIASTKGEINSNYGWAIWSRDNGFQFERVLEELARNPDSRRAQMIYTRPSMHDDYKRDGMSDFMCTSNAQYFIRRGKLHVSVYMRSNDAFFGYRNDFHWQKYVLNELVNELRKKGVDIIPGEIYWNVGSLHLYEKHFYFLDYYADTGEYSATKKEIDEYYRIKSENK